MFNIILPQKHTFFLTDIFIKNAIIYCNQFVKTWKKLESDSNFFLKVKIKYKNKLH
jgi:hypothetical protein